MNKFTPRKIWTWINKIHIHSARSNEHESSADAGQNGAGDTEPETPQVDEATQERYRQIFKSYMHVYLDTRARKKGYASFFDYCEFNTDLESQLLDVTKDRSREAGIHPWWGMHTEPNQLPLNLDGIPAGPYLRVLVLGPETSGEPSVKGMVEYLKQRSQFCLGIGVEKGTPVEGATEVDLTKDELSLIYDCVIDLSGQRTKLDVSRMVRFVDDDRVSTDPSVRFVSKKGEGQDIYRDLWKACIDP